MKLDPDRQLHAMSENQWHSVLGQCDSEALTGFDASRFAAKVRQRYRRRNRRRLLVGGGISAALLLAVVTLPAWERSAVSHHGTVPPASVGRESSGGQDTLPATGILSKATSGELDSVIQRFRSEVEALDDAGRAADERRRVHDAASRVVEQIRQQAEISVLYSPTPHVPRAS